MDSICQYFLSIIVAALVCSIVKALVGSKSGYGRVVSLVCGTFMTITLLSPWVNWDFKEFALPSDGPNAEGDSIARQAQEETRNELRSIIKERTEAYILDKALSMDADIQVDVILHEDEPIPVGAVITGDLSPYNKTVLSRYMLDALAIAEEAQIWKSHQP